MKFHGVGVGPLLTDTVIVFAFPTIFDDLHRGIHVGFVGENRGRFFLVNFLINEA